MTDAKLSLKRGSILVVTSFSIASLSCLSSCFRLVLERSSLAKSRLPVNPRAARSKETSMSSENRWISRKTFEREVPPLKHIWGTPWREKRWRSVQQTQKSFSMAVLVELRRLAVSSRYALRSAAASLAKVSIQVSRHDSAKNRLCPCRRRRQQALNLRFYGCREFF